MRTLVLLRRYDEAQAELARFPEGKYRDHGLALLHELPDRRAEADAALGATRLRCPATPRMSSCWPTSMPFAA